jgi:hypothetical protein
MYFICILHEFLYINFTGMSGVALILCALLKERTRGQCKCGSGSGSGSGWVAVWQWLGGSVAVAAVFKWSGLEHF